MRTSIAMRMAAVGTAIALAGAMAVIASGTTGAYFSDSKTGGIGGTVGSIKVQTSGGTGTNGADFAFVNLTPGDFQTITVAFQNVGTLPQDVYLTFPNGQALHALNNLGSYGEVHITDTAGAPLFDSANLSDGRKFADGSGTCGTLAPTGCWPVPAQLKVASNVASGGTGSVSFSFRYDKKLSSTGGGAFNSYPLANGEGSTADLAGTPLQYSGLPIAVVATQVGK